MEAPVVEIAQCVRTEIERAHPDLCVNRLDFSANDDPPRPVARHLWRVSVSGSADALVAAGITSRAALESLPASGSGVRDDRLISRNRGGYRVLLLMEHAETWLAPLSWQAIQRTRAKV